MHIFAHFLPKIAFGTFPFSHTSASSSFAICLNSQRDSASFGFTQQLCANSGMEMPTFETAEEAEVFARLVYSGCF